jgi:hypothetical protein
MGQRTTRSGDRPDDWGIRKTDCGCLATRGSARDRKRYSVNMPRLRKDGRGYVLEDLSKEVGLCHR